MRRTIGPSYQRRSEEQDQTRRRPHGRVGSRASGARPVGVGLGVSTLVPSLPLWLPQAHETLLHHRIATGASCVLARPTGASSRSGVYLGSRITASCRVPFLATCEARRQPFPLSSSLPGDRAGCLGRSASHRQTTAPCCIPPVPVQACPAAPCTAPWIPYSGGAPSHSLKWKRDGTVLVILFLHLPSDTSMCLIGLQFGS